MKPITLDDLLNDLEKSAGFPPEADDKDEKKDDKKDDKEKKPEDKKKDSGEGEDDKKEQEKSAAFKSGAELAKEIMEKVASVKIEQTNTNKEEDIMNKQASEAGKALAQALLKKAGVGDTNTTNGIPAGVVPNKTQVDLAQQVAEHDAIIQSTPGTDGSGNGGTVNQIFDAIVADALGKGAKDEKVTGGVAPSEGAANSQAPAQVPVSGAGAIGDGQEKAAAVSQLVADGFDFDQAVNLVKQASDELENEHNSQVKQAAFNELIGSGVSFADAVAMVKAASASTDSVDQEKQAAVNSLVASGIDFDQAIDLVNAKADELYGK